MSDEAGADPRDRPVARLDASPPTAAVLATTLVQSLVLFALYRAAEAGALDDAPQWAVPLWSLALAVPTLVVLTLGIGPVRPLLAGVTAWGAVLAASGAWLGSQLLPADEVHEGATVAVWALTMAVATFKVHLYLQARAVGAPFDYRVLFAASWRGAQVPLLALLFVGLLYGILALWGALFDVIGIDAFQVLFRRDWFVFPVLGLAFGVGVLLFRRLADRLGRFDAQLRSLMVLLLPLLLAIAVAFVAALPFTGLDALWDTGFGTGLLLVLQALILFAVNAVYQDRAEADVYPRPVERALGPALAVLPVLALLAGEGLRLRIAQYGLTVDRFWGLLVWALLAAYGAGYLLAVVRRTVPMGRARPVGAWVAGIAPVNTVLGLVLVAVLLAANSPLLDPRRLAVASQLDRVEAGEIERAELDFAYFRYSLARPGWLAMERLRAEHGDDEALLVALERASPPLGRGPVERNVLERDLERLPPDLDVPEEVLEQIARMGALPGEQSWIVGTDLDDDGARDYLWLASDGRGLRGSAWTSEVVDVDSGDGSDERRVLRFRALRLDYTEAERRSAIEALREGRFDTARPRFDDVVLGELAVGVY